MAAVDSDEVMSLIEKLFSSTGEYVDTIIESTMFPININRRGDVISINVRIFKTQQPAWFLQSDVPFSFETTNEISYQEVVDADETVWSEMIVDGKTLYFMPLISNTDGITMMDTPPIVTELIDMFRSGETFDTVSNEELTLGSETSFVVSPTSTTLSSIGTPTTPTRPTLEGTALKSPGLPTPKPPTISERLLSPHPRPPPESPELQTPEQPTISGRLLSSQSPNTFAERNDTFGDMKHFRVKRDRKLRVKKTTIQNLVRKGNEERAKRAAKRAEKGGKTKRVKRRKTKRRKSVRLHT